MLATNSKAKAGIINSVSDVDYYEEVSSRVAPTYVYILSSVVERRTYDCHDFYRVWNESVVGS
jgi:hypothetical protein